MIDYFGLLGEPRRPWLEPQALKARFLSVSIQTHPDRVHNESSFTRKAATDTYADLNAAYACLRETKTRLQHLLELEQGSKPKAVQEGPPGMMDVFTQVSQLCRLVDGFLAERNGLHSPLLRVQGFEKGFEWIDKLNALNKQLATRLNELTAELQRMNAVWDEAPPLGSPARLSALPLERLEQVCQLCGYLTRWMTQIQERLVQLSL